MKDSQQAFGQEITGPTTYIVVCEVQEELVLRTITYNTSGGSGIPPASYAVGSVINDFERGDGEYYSMGRQSYTPWMVDEVELVYQKAGTYAEWHCEYVTPYAWLPNLYYDDYRVSGDQIPVGRWFDQKEESWKGQVTGFERRITDVGNFGDIADEIILNSGDTGSYNFEYDGMVTDQFAMFFGTDRRYAPGQYNAYNFGDAPQLSITADDEEYDDCLDYGINTIAIDKAALYEAMKAKGDTEITLTVTLTFPERSAVSGEDEESGIRWSNVWTETITVRIADCTQSD